jgi:hypothetical protein
MSDKACSATVCFAVCRPNDPHHLSIELEVDFGVGRRPACSRISTGIVTCPLDVCGISSGGLIATVPAQSVTLFVLPK